MSTVKTNNVQIGQSVTATNNFTWYQPASPDGTVRLGNGNSGSVTDLVTLTSAGNLGIGTSSPGAKLELSTGTGTKLRITSTVDNNADIDFYTNGVYRGIIEGNSLGMLFGTTGALPCTFITNNTEKMRLDSSGNLGLGVTPSAWGSSIFKALQIGSGNGFIVGRSDGINQIQLGTGAYFDGTNWIYKLTGVPAARYYIQDNAHYWNIAPSGTAGNAISFTQAMTLDASGNLLLGATSPAYQERLYVAKANNGGTGIAVFENTNAANGDQCVRTILGANTSNTTSYFYVARGGGSDKFYVYGNGNVVNVNNSYGALSDESIKENIEYATPKLADLLNVKVRSFNLKGDEAKQIGVVAQELEEVFPAMVEIDGMSGLKQVKYSVFVPMLIKAIQELSAELNELKAKVNA